MAFFQGKRLFIYRKTANTMISNEIAEDLRISSFSMKWNATERDIIKKKEGESRIFQAPRQPNFVQKNPKLAAEGISEGIENA